MIAKRLIGLAAAVAIAGGIAGAQVRSAYALTPQITCQSASAWKITPGLGGAVYTIKNGAGYCLQGAPYDGDWTVFYSGSGTASVFTCAGGFGVVQGLHLSVTLTYFNNKKGTTAVAHETWTQVAPISPYGFVALNVAPGNTFGLMETHIFGQCPPGGTPSAYVQWNDENAPH